jgi:hypothetical protein
VSFTRAPGDLSNLGPRPWMITVIAILIVVWRPFAEAVSAYADAVSVGALIVGCGTAVKYRNLRGRPCSPAAL